MFDMFRPEDILRIFCGVENGGEKWRSCPHNNHLLSLGLPVKPDRRDRPVILGQGFIGDSTNHRFDVLKPGKLTYCIYDFRISPDYQKTI